LADQSIPPRAKIPADSSVEMSWKVFAGTYQELYLALIRERCHKDGLGTSEEVIDTQFRLHLHRGIDVIFADREIKTISSLVTKALSSNPSTK
jgi:DNA sulfur modification protein DndE